MTGSFIIEVAGETAGLALPDRNGYRFVATVSSYAALDGTSFRSITKVQRAAEDFARRNRRGQNRS